jgi:hypothetical protein
LQTLRGPATTPQTVGNPQPIVSFEYRVALVPAASAYVSNLDVSLVLADTANTQQDSQSGKLISPISSGIVPLALRA